MFQPSKEKEYQRLFDMYSKRSEEELLKILEERDRYGETAIQVVKDILQSDRREYYDNLEEKHIYYEKDDSHKLTTGNNFEGYAIKEYKGLVSGEVCLGTGFLSDIKAGVIDLFGESSNEYSDKIKEAKRLAVRKMVQESIEINCNAIIGISYQVAPFASNNMIMVSVNGTAVIIEKLDN